MGPEAPPKPKSRKECVFRAAQGAYGDPRGSEAFMAEEMSWASFQSSYMFGEPLSNITVTLVFGAVKTSSQCPWLKERRMTEVVATAQSDKRPYES